jgi:alpha/beta superfamily hydrolase
MNAHTERSVIPGPAGPIECAIDRPRDGAASRGLAVVAHPHPLHGGTLDNKVVQTIVRAGVQLGWTCVRFNFRGVGGTAGTHDEGRGEADDLVAVVRAHQATLQAEGQALALAGFSFGAYVVTFAAAALAEAGTPAQQLLLVGPSTQRARPAGVPAHTLVIHGEADDVVPLAATLDWARPQNLPVLVLPGVGHFFHGQLPLLRELIVRHWH